MTMIACTIDRSAPLIIGDLLISDSLKPERFIIPVLRDDVMQYLSNDSELSPIRLDQKIYILKPNVCIAFAGQVFHIKHFLEDISIFCRSHEYINDDLIHNFLTQNKNEDWKHFSFLVLVITKEDDQLGIGRFLHGKWNSAISDLFGEVLTSGSGSRDFLREINEDAKFVTQFLPDDGNYSIQAYIIMICKLLTKERLTLESVRKHWGAGFEMIFFQNNHFTKLDDIAYVINHGSFNDIGEINEVPVPAIILYYKYQEGTLVITAIQTYKGTTTATETEYLISCDSFGVAQFLVSPIYHTISEVFENHTISPSFSCSRIAMGYIIDTPIGHYLPASFNTGSEICITYEHSNKINLTMRKEINDRMTQEAKLVYPNLK